MKYHVPPDGIVRECKAHKIPCKYGGADYHFDTFEEAQDFSDRITELRAKYRITETSLDKFESKLLSVLLDENEEKSHSKYDLARNMLAELNLVKRKSVFITKEIKDVLFDISMPDGGGTYNPLNNLSPQAGFCYSKYPERCETFLPTISKEEQVDMLFKFASKNSDILAQDNHFIGLWNDPDTGVVYLDISVVTMDSRVARKDCKKHDQKAFFNLQTFNSVSVDKNAKSGQHSADLSGYLK